MPHVGAGTTPEEAIRPLIIDAGGMRIGMISMTTVTGDYVNDSLPDATAPQPANLAEQDRWQYELRTFGFGSEGDAAYVPSDARRPGTIWGLFDDLESQLTPGDAADLWQDIVRVYPELQDWVKERLASYSYPREVAFLDALPMTVTGKVIRKELKARAAAEVN